MDKSTAVNNLMDNYGEMAGLERRELERLIDSGLSKGFSVKQCYNGIRLCLGMEYGQHISLKSIADRFRMNATYLGQIFIKETGMKFSEYLMAYRMHVARGQIVNTDEKISAIAADVGYSNMNYFYQHFHGFYGITPSEMRAGK